MFQTTFPSERKVVPALIVVDMQMVLSARVDLIQLGITLPIIER